MAWWLNEIPCIHRIHDEKPLNGAQKIQKMLGMSISLSLFEQKATEFSDTLLKSNRKSNIQQRALLTFDDGHKDILKTVPFLKKHPEIQPVLFLTGRQLKGEVIPLPLTALYTWCEKNNKNPNNLQEELGFNRRSLKLLPETEQRKALESAGIDINPPEEEMIGVEELNFLIENNWLIGYHGSHHCDLRIHKPQQLEQCFKNDFNLFRHPSYIPWFAWPEGRWNDGLCLMAEDAGFIVQFGLKGEKGIGESSNVVNREIWK